MHARFPCCGTFQQARTWNRRHRGTLETMQAWGTNKARCRDKMRLVFHRGTLWPHGLNMDFIFYFLYGLTRAHFYPAIRVARTTVNLFNNQLQFHTS